MLLDSWDNSPIGFTSEYGASSCCTTTAAPTLDELKASMASMREQILAAERGPDRLLLTSVQYEAVKKHFQPDDPTPAPRSMDSIFGLPIEVYPDVNSLLKRIADNLLSEKPLKLAYCHDDTMPEFLGKAAAHA